MFSASISTSSGGGKVERDGAAGVDAVAGIADRGAVDRDATRQDQRLVARARQLGHARSQHAVEPFAGLLGGDHQFLAARLRQVHEQSVGRRRPATRSRGRAHGREGAMADADLRRHHHGGDRRGDRRHRLSRFQGRGKRARRPDVTALLPKGARIVATAVAEDRIAVTVDIGGGDRNPHLRRARRSSRRGGCGSRPSREISGRQCGAFGVPISIGRESFIGTSRPLRSSVAASFSSAPACGRSPRPGAASRAAGGWRPRSCPRALPIWGSPAGPPARSASCRRPSPR